MKMKVSQAKRNWFVLKEAPVYKRGEFENNYAR